MEKRNVPKLRFKGFEDEWKKQNLNNIVERVVRKNKDSISNRPLTISAQYGLVDQEEFFNKIVASKNLEGYYLLNNGDFAYNKSYSNGYPFGAIKRLDRYENGAVSTLYICFKNRANTDSDFLVQYFETSRWHKEVSGIAVEGARNHGLLNISVLDFFETIHRIPSLEEQTKIANFLSNIDNVIEEQEGKVKDLEQYKKGMMQKIFKQEVRFRDENGGEYPEWEEKKLENIIINRKKGDIANYSNKGNILLTNEYLEKKIIKEILVSNEIDVFSNHILILWDGSQAGKVYTGLKGVLGSTFVSIELNKFNDNYFVYQYLNMKKHLIQEVWREGSGVPHVAKDFLNKFKLKLPGLEEQTKIANFLSNIDNIIEEEKKKLEDLKLWKKGLLQQMFV
ncbi:type I restriction modification DNA specificity domain protein [Clostridium baratii str. Sullivan]|uniref:Type I restriction modification DNA specificity domain protein n=1 Tax=Clostridium baratii str. Sullivan TaxID=1415775 RepID=A0A0A7FUD7_9CLOT|nr:restriction endonuclease subunit S [Clostridium baratii]AIY83229.1 type I restriction modification DNA specificity domain protein [Clostridium baratii str. Sullivan]